MGQGWRIGSVFFLVLSTSVLTGCGKGEGAWNSFPVEIYADSALISTREGESDLTEAMAFWEARAGKKLFDYKGVWKGGQPYSGPATEITQVTANVIFFQNPWAFGNQVAGRTTTIKTGGMIENAVIMINPNISFCSGDCKNAYGSTSNRNTLAHELGHFIGLGHTPDTANIMYPDVLRTSSLTSVKVDGDALKSVTGI